MRKIRVYVDTSVFGGTQDAGFSDKCLQFFSKVHAGEFLVILSDLTLLELAEAPEPVQNVLRSLPGDSVEFLAMSNDVTELKEKYLEAGVLGKASHKDAQHVAAASVAGADLILSLNFKHIVNFGRILGFNSVNMAMGYRTMTILSPLEVIEDEI